MRINEILVESNINEEVLTELDWSKLKKGIATGLISLAALGLAGKASAADVKQMSDAEIKQFVMSQIQQGNTDPAKVKAALMAKMGISDVKSADASKTAEPKPEIKKTVSNPIVDKNSGYYKQIDLKYEKNPFGDLLKGSGWESPRSGEMAKLKTLDAKSVPGNPNLIAVFTTSVWGVKQFDKGMYKGLYARGEPEQIWGVRVFDKATGEEYTVYRDYTETDVNSVKKFFNSGNFKIGKNIGHNPFLDPYFNQAKKIIK